MTFSSARLVSSSTAAARTPISRKSARVELRADVELRRAGHNNYRVHLYDMSPHGCKVEFVTRPKLDETVWVKIDGLESLEALVCWVNGFEAGVEFVRPIHPAVFDFLINRLQEI